MLDYRLHYAILANEDRLRDAARDRVARQASKKRVFRPTDGPRTDRFTRR